MPQGFTKPQQNTRPNSFRLRQDLGYIPARAMAEGDGGGGITSTGGPSAPILTLTPIALGDVLANLAGADPDVPVSTPFVFTNLQDVPHSYTGKSLQLVRVNAGATALEFATISAELDTFSATRGAVLFRGAAGWQALAPGTAGQALESGGAGADPSWGTVSGGSTPVYPLTNGDPTSSLILFGNAQIIGVPVTTAHLDTTVEAYLAVGLAASRPVTPVITTGATTCYLASDTGKFFVWSGSGWVQTN
jgi:hypothetical protein